MAVVAWNVSTSTNSWVFFFEFVTEFLFWIIYISSNVIKKVFFFKKKPFVVLVATKQRV